jgi:hypothetical protein
MMSRRQRAEQRREDTRRFADVALNFEEYMRRYFGPFQELINQTAQIDSGMGRTVQEISTLAEEVVGATANLVNLEELLQLEVVSAEIQDHLGLALERAALERDWAGGGLGLISDSDLDQTSVDRAISQIQGYLDSELGRLQQRFPDGEIPLLPIAPSWEGVGGGFTLTGENLSFDLPKNGGKLKFIAVPGGTLTMEGGHKVNLQPFLMGKYPITQRQYQAVMGKNPSHFKGENRPVEKVNWHEARSFCQKLSKILGQQIDLPSETQWEWAARGATQSQGFEYAGSNNLDEVGWYDGNSGKQTHPVGQKKPNELGLYDLSGNVWEWCKDNWTDNSNALPRDGSALTSDGNSDLRAVRGGSWHYDPEGCRCALRDRLNPVSRYDNLGFRVCVAASAL